MGNRIAAGAGSTASSNKRLSSKEQSGFLNHLAATGSVELAAQAVAIAPLDAYAACRTNAGFALGWRAALRVGYDRLEAMLIERTAAVLAGDANGPLETPDVLFALRLVDRHRDMDRPEGKALKPSAVADRTDAAILKRLAMLGKRQAAEEARARQAQGGGDA